MTIEKKDKNINGHKYVQKRAKDQNVKTSDKEYYNNNKQN